MPPLPNQVELRELAQGYINPRSAGGEGHLEVGKTIYYSKKRLAHMVLSVKPFGCMPSTQSDGVQVAVVAHFPEVIFLPIETSPEGEVNAYSRVQMAWARRRSGARRSSRRRSQRTGLDIETIRAYVAQQPGAAAALQRVPRVSGRGGAGGEFRDACGGADEDGSGNGLAASCAAR